MSLSNIHTVPDSVWPCSPSTAVQAEGWSWELQVRGKQERSDVSREKGQIKCHNGCWWVRTAPHCQDKAQCHE